TCLVREAGTHGYEGRPVLGLRAVRAARGGERNGSDLLRGATMSQAADAIRERRREYYTRISQQHLSPLWEVLSVLVPKQPQPTCVPAFWKYDDLRPSLMEAGELITAHEATRRVLILENPAYRGQSRVTNTLYAGLQLLKPGEVAPAHRHTQSSQRYVRDDSCRISSVDGVSTYMTPGELDLTPYWTWHDTGGTESQEPVIWHDTLDIPPVQMLHAGFSEHLATEQQPIARPE